MDADSDTIANRPVFVNLLGAHVTFQAAVHLLGDLAQRQFTQGNQVTATKKVSERLLDLLRYIHIPASHAVLQCLWRKVDHYCFIGSKRHPIGNRFANGDPRDVANNGSDAFDVLDVQRCDDVDFFAEEFLHVIIAFAVFAPWDVCVGKFIDQHDLRFASNSGIHVHFLEDSSFVFDFTTRDLFELCGEFLNGFSPVALDNTNDHIFATLVPADSFT